jgi:hypothetical protein
MCYLGVKSRVSYLLGENRLNISDCKEFQL